MSDWDEYDLKALDRTFKHTNVLANGCIEFTGSRLPKGYGRLNYKGDMILTHRFVYYMCVGDIPTGLCVLHSCDNPPCCNPEHLFLGSYQDNMDDMRAKGREVFTRGSDRPAAILTEAVVLQIRELLSSGNYTNQQIGDMYGVAAKTISGIKNRDIWKHV